MKKLKILLSISLCLLILFLTTGCGSKKVISSEEFEKVADKYDLEVTSIIDDYVNQTVIKSALLAQNPDDGWGIAFYELTDDISATSMFETNKSIFESAKGSGSVESEVNVSNYSTYSLKTDNTYMYICRVDNTLLYIAVDKEYKDTVTKIVDELGY